jgi:hypothetical protein
MGPVFTGGDRQSPFALVHTVINAMTSHDQLDCGLCRNDKKSLLSVIPAEAGIQERGHQDTIQLSNTSPYL